MEDKCVKPIVIYCILTILVIFLTGCSTNIPPNETNSSTEVSVTSSIDEMNEISFLDSFIAKYNDRETIPISDCIDFIASDKNSGYYRTAFRLLAFDNAKSKHGKIGTSNIDMIDYSSNLGATDFEQFRVYIYSDDTDNNKKIATTTIKILDSSISDENIKNAYNSISSSFVLGNYIKGTITKKEIMIDFTRTTTH